MRLMKWFGGRLGKRKRLPVNRLILQEEISKFIEENRDEILRRTIARIAVITGEVEAKSNAEAAPLP